MCDSCFRSSSSIGDGGGGDDASHFSIHAMHAYTTPHPASSAPAFVVVIIIISIIIKRAHTRIAQCGGGVGPAAFIYFPSSHSLSPTVVGGGGEEKGGGVSTNRFTSSPSIASFVCVVVSIAEPRHCPP